MTFYQNMMKSIKTVFSPWLTCLHKWASPSKFCGLFILHYEFSRFVNHFEKSEIFRFIGHKDPLQYFTAQSSAYEGEL